jgi:glycosyltransferase involved in cell wall biosynthesis
VVAAWRERERRIRALGVDLVLVVARRWEEGGVDVTAEPGADGFVLPVRTFGRHPARFLYDPVGLWRALGRERWDLLDLHEEPFSAAVAEIRLLAALRGRRTPFVVYSAQNLEKRYPPPFRWFERSAVRRAAGAHTCNAEAGAILRRKGLTGAWRLLPLGVDTAEFAPADRPPPAGELVVGFVGRLIPHKGVDVLVEAAALDARLRVAVYGDGPEAAALAERARTAGVDDRVAFHGHVGPEGLADAYRSLDALAVPSRDMPGWVEQFGRVVVEAQASGVPVVASASGALPDVVGHAGLLVPPDDPPALAAALGRLLDEPDLWTGLRRAGADAAARCTWEQVAEDQVAFYREALGVSTGRDGPAATTSR